MRILLASSSSGSRGGGEGFLIYLGAALAARGHETVLWTSGHARMDETAEKFAAFGQVVRADYVNTYDRRGRSLAALLDGGTARRVAREWQELRPDLVHVNKQNLEDGLDLLRAAELAALPSVCTIHITQSAAFLKARGAWMRDAVARHALRRYRGVMVAVAAARARDLERFLRGHGVVRVIENGVPVASAAELARFREAGRAELGLGERELAVVAVGRLTPQKRPLLFLELAARIARIAPEARFFWVGDGPLAAEWDAKAKEVGIETKVERLGWKDEARTYLAAGDLLLHVAEYEGLPLALLEAMAAGLPCAVDEALYAELAFLEEANSIRVTTGSDAWMGLLRDGAELARRGSMGRALAAERFSTQVMGERYEALYREAMAR